MPGDKRPNTTQSFPAYGPLDEDIGRGWLLVLVGLLLTALVSLWLRPVCLPDVPGANEYAVGVRHERRAGVWYHCEPWIVRALRE